MPRTLASNTTEFWRRALKSKQPQAPGSPVAPMSALEPTPPAAFDQPHENLLVDPVGSYLDAQMQFQGEQIDRAKDLVANAIVPQTHADAMAMQAAGAQRISIGGSLPYVAAKPIIAACETLLENGSFDWLADMVPPKPSPGRRVRGLSGSCTTLSLT